jgi:unsaturated rhamnogalacturonyl hydrolase
MAGLLVGCALMGQMGAAQTPGQSERLAHALVAQHREGGAADGLVLKALDAAWYNSAEGEDFRSLRQAVDAYLRAPSGTSGNDALMGAEVLRLYRVTLDAGYFKAATHMRDAFAAMCAKDSAAESDDDRAASCAAAAPFLAEYAAVFDEPGLRTTIAATLLRRAERAPSPMTAMALVDAIPDFSWDDPRWAALIAGFARDAAKGLHGEAAKSVTVEPTALLVYAVLKGVRLGYLPRGDAEPALRVWSRIEHSTDGNERAQAALLLASTEVDLAPDAGLARGETILIDAWFNSQQRKNAAGQTGPFHYKWDDYSDSGFSLLGHLFRSVGMKTGTLAEAPTRTNLSGARYYIIVSPDIPVKNPNPHYMTEENAAAIAAWVKGGGVLILMENDPPNADITHLNLLADRFGIHFDDVLHHHVIGEQVESGRIAVAADGELFHEPHTFYMKDTCAISLRGAARALLQDRGDVVMAQARFGKGVVFAVVDPWLYNEYTDGRTAPAETYAQFDNFAGGRELVRWLAREPRAAATKER